MEKVEGPNILSCKEDNCPKYLRLERRKKCPNTGRYEVLFMIMTTACTLSGTVTVLWGLGFKPR
jgi:hypothetical protein